MPEKYFLHYIGKGLYTKEQFIEECKKVGVNRALPPQKLKHMKFGDTILLAQYEPFPKEPDKESFGKAVVFGYYTISGLNFVCPKQEEFMEKLSKTLTITSEDHTVRKVVRQCGTYILANSYVVTDEITDILTTVMKLEKEMQVKVKCFASGKFTSLANKEIAPLKFTLGGRVIELDQKINSEAIKDKQIGFFSDYNQRLYLLKNEKVIA